MTAYSAWMPVGVWQFHESGTWLVKGEHTMESAVAAINAAFELTEDGYYEPVDDIGVYPDDCPSRLFTVDDFGYFGCRWHRWIPAPRDDPDYRFYLHDAAPHSRGAFQAAELAYR